MRYLLTVVLISFSSVLFASKAPIFTTTLANGMRVIVKQDNRSPTVISQIWYRVGSADEYRSKTGLAHAFEHLMFKGTKNYPTGEFSKIVSQNGGYENAFTSQDFTAYYEALPSDKLAIAFELEADRMQHLLFDPIEIHKELEVIKEERRLRVDDNPQALGYERHLALAHLTLPYHHPTIGWMDDIKNFSLPQLKAWYQKWYAPNNAILVVVGAVDHDEVVNLAKKYFAKIPSRIIPKKSNFKEVEYLGKRYLTLNLALKTPYTYMSFNVPSLKTAVSPEDSYALYALSQIFDGSLAARFETNLVRAKQIASETFVYYPIFSRYETLFLIGAKPQSGVELQQLQQAILQEIKRVQQDGVSEQELARVKIQIDAQQNFDQDSPSEQASLLGQLAAVDLPLDLAKDFHKHIEQLTTDKLQQVAKQYFNSDNIAITDLLPLNQQEG